MNSTRNKWKYKWTS